MRYSCTPARITGMAGYVLVDIALIVTCQPGSFFMELVAGCVCVHACMWLSLPLCTCGGASAIHIFILVNVYMHIHIYVAQIRIRVVSWHMFDRDCQAHRRWHLFLPRQGVTVCMHVHACLCHGPCVEGFEFSTMPCPILPSLPRDS